MLDHIDDEDQALRNRIAELESRLDKFKEVSALALEALQWAYGWEPIPTMEKEAIDKLKVLLFNE